MGDYITLCCSHWAEGVPVPPCSPPTHIPCHDNEHWQMRLDPVSPAVLCWAVFRLLTQRWRHSHRGDVLVTAACDKNLNIQLKIRVTLFHLSIWQTLNSPREGLKYNRSLAEFGLWGHPHIPRADFSGPTRYVLHNIFVVIRLHVDIRCAEISTRVFIPRLAELGWINPAGIWAKPSQEFVVKISVIKSAAKHRMSAHKEDFYKFNANYLV